MDYSVHEARPLMGHILLTNTMQGRRSRIPMTLPPANCKVNLNPRRAGLKKLEHIIVDPILDGNVNLHQPQVNKVRQGRLTRDRWFINGPSSSLHPGISPNYFVARVIGSRTYHSLK